MNTGAINIPKHLMRETEQGTQSKGAMGKEDFLKLLMAQLRAQDPLNPMNHQEFATQLAQFSQLEQLSNIGKGIEGMQSGKGEEAKLQALGMIGKEVRASGSRVELQVGKPVQLKYLPDAEVTPVKASILSENGALVREMDLVGQAGDTGAVQWDGMDSNGTPAAAGKYTFRIFGVGKNGQAKELSSELSGKVTGIETEGNQAYLLLDTGGGGSTRMEINRVAKVMQAEEKPSLVQKPSEPQQVKGQAQLLAELQQKLKAQGVGAAEAEPEAEPESEVPEEPWHGGNEIFGRWVR